jgi:spore maturation protein CgeB
LETNFGSIFPHLRISHAEMQIVIFGLSVSSSWGNGHATLWRGLCKALARQGHHITFFEQDVSYYAKHRDLACCRDYRLILYRSWEEIEKLATGLLDQSDCSVLTSYCPNTEPITSAIFNSRSRRRIFYDLDAPITLERLNRGEKVDYIPSCGLAPFDLVLSYTGGRALNELKTRLGARRVCPLYGSVDPETHKPASALPAYSADLSYLGTYAADRQLHLQQFLLEPARRMPEKHFLIAGAMYPADFPWRQNISFVPHIPPPQHPAFYCSSRLTLNITRAAMADLGFCPSGRLFEAAACGVPIVSDCWQGLETFFEPGREILLVSNSDEAEQALHLPDLDLDAIKCAAHRRVMQEHTSDHRASEFLRMVA